MPLIPEWERRATLPLPPGRRASADSTFSRRRSFVFRSPEPELTTTTPDTPSKGILKTGNRGTFLPGPNLLAGTLSGRLRGRSQYGSGRDYVRRQILRQQFDTKIREPPPLSKRQEVQIEEKEAVMTESSAINRVMHWKLLQSKTYDSLPFFTDEDDLGFGMQKDNEENDLEEKTREFTDAAVEQPSAAIQETCQHPIAFILAGDTTGMTKQEWRDYLKHVQALRDAEHFSMKRRHQNLDQSYVQDLGVSSFHSNVFTTRGKKTALPSELGFIDPERTPRQSVSAPQLHKTVRIEETPPLKSSTAPSPVRPRPRVPSRRERTFVTWNSNKDESRQGSELRLISRSRDLHPVSTGLRREGTSTEQTRFGVPEMGRIPVRKVWNGQLKPTHTHREWLHEAGIR